MTTFSEALSRKAIAATFSLAAILAGASGCGGPAANGSCTSNLQCVGTQVCVAGTCVASENTDSGPGNNNADANDVITEDRYCQSCTSDSDCGGPGNFCVTLPGSPSFCGNACSSNAQCSADAKCYTITEGGSAVGQNCLPKSGSCSGANTGRDAGQNNNGHDAGNTGGGVGYCGSCTSDSDCPAGGYCLGSGSDGSGPPYCGEPCGANNACPSDATCYQIQDQSGNVVGDNCFPTSGECTGNTNPPDAGNVTNPPDAGNVTNPTDAGPGGTLPTIALTGCGIVGYLAPVKIGTQSFNLSIDTGSSTTAVASSGCSGCTGVSPLYTSDSTTQSTGKTSSETYGDGSGWSGPVVSDVISITPAPASVRLEFAEITKSNGFFRNYDCSGNSVSTSLNQGIIGLGPADLVTPNTQDFITQLLGDAANNLSDAFATQLCPQGNGHMWLGGYDTNYASGAPQYAALNGSQYWEISVSSLKMGSTSVGSLGASVLDTGTTINLLPSTVISAIENQLKSSSAMTTVFGSRGYNVIFGNSQNCVPAQGGMSITEVNATLPSVAMTISASGGGTITVDVPATGVYLSVEGSGNSTYYCNGMQDSSGLGISALLGDVFLSSFITIWDLKNNRVGLAPESTCN
jgi:hypothetical protein